MNMLQVKKVEFYIYAESDEEISDFKNSISSFIEEHRKAGRAVTAKKVSFALSKWKDNIFVKNNIIKFLSNE